jgi:hypothetical protein
MRQQQNVQDDITEALEQERKKLNLMVFNLSSSDLCDAGQLTTLFEHISGDRAPSFRCSRVGKPGNGKNKSRPLLVNFDTYDDRNYILRCARDLREMKAEWRKVSIASDRTKRQ